MANLNQLPDEVNLAFVAGDTFRIRIRVIDPTSGDAELIDPDTEDTGEPGEYKFCARIVKDPERTPAADFVIETDPDLAGYAVIMTLPPSETAPLPGMPGSDGKRFQGLWDLEVTFPNGDVRTVAAGTVVCGIDVSQCILPGP